MIAFFLLFAFCLVEAIYQENNQPISSEMKIKEEEFDRKSYDEYLCTGKPSIGALVWEINLEKKANNISIEEEYKHIYNKNRYFNEATIASIIKEIKLETEMIRNRSEQ